MPDQADGWYDRTKPWNSNEERITSERLVDASQAQAQPGWRKQPLFPPRFGYEQRPLTVQDCFDIATQYGDARDDFSRVTSGYSGSSTPSLPVT